MEGSVPVISLNIGSSKKSFPPAMIERFGNSLKNYGFVSVVDHGFNLELLKAGYEVAARALSLPNERLAAYAHPTDKNMGYMHFGFETPLGSKHADLKNAWHIRRRDRDDNVFPDDLVPDFRTVMLDLFDAFDRFNAVLAPVFDAYLGKPDGMFADMVRGGVSLMRVVRYPDLEEIQTYQDWKLEDGQQPGGEHGDINFWTSLPAATKAGLEIQRRDGEWIPVNNPPEAMIINVGDMLQAHTGGYLRSSPHRVTGRNKTGARYSIPFFVHPRSEVILYERPDGTPVTAGEDLCKRLDEIYKATAA